LLASTRTASPTASTRTASPTARARAEVAFSLMRIVGTAAKFDVLGGGRPASSEWHEVMELQEIRRGAAAIRADERASSPILIPHLAPDTSRHVT
jgi:hypothetical protein